MNPQSIYIHPRKKNKPLAKDLCFDTRNAWQGFFSGVFFCWDLFITGVLTFITEMKIGSYLTFFYNLIRSCTVSGNNKFSAQNFHSCCQWQQQCYAAYVCNNIDNYQGRFME